MSNTKVTGRVFKVFEKTWPAKNPKFKPNTTYSIKLEDDPIYYRTQKENYQGLRYAGIAEPGNLITFEASPIDEKSAQMETAPALVVQDTTAPATLAQTGSGSVGSYASRDASIQYQSSRKDALEFVSLITTTGAVKLPEKPANKLQALEALLDKYTADFYQDISTQGAVKRAAGEEEVAAPTPAKRDEE